MSNNIQSQKNSENSLYNQLKKDLRKAGKRDYVPVALFKNPEDIHISRTHLSIKSRLVSIVSSIVK